MAQEHSVLVKICFCWLLNLGHPVFFHICGNICICNCIFIVFTNFTKFTIVFVSKSTQGLSQPHTLCHRICRVYWYHLNLCWYISSIFHLSRIQRQQHILQYGFSMLVPLLLCKKWESQMPTWFFCFCYLFLKANTLSYIREKLGETNLSQVFLDFVQFSKHLMGIGVRPETNLRKEKPPFPATFWILNSMQAGARKLKNAANQPLHCAHIWK